MKRHLYLIILLCATPAFSQSFEAWAAKAEKAQKSGDNEIAVEFWTNALRVWRKGDGKPKRAKALSSRAGLYEKNGEVDGALSDLNMAVKLDPKNSVLFFRRGQLLADQGKLAEAISDFYSATTLNIKFADAYMQRGLAYEKQGDAKFAKEDFTVACKYGVDDACIRVGKRPKGGPKKKKAEEPEEQDSEPADADSARAATAEPDEDNTPVVKTRRRKKAAPTPKEEPEAEAEAKPAKPAKKVAKAPTPPPKPAAKPIDFGACTAAIEACTEDGTALDHCVRQAKPCDDKSVKGCCPITCVREFDRHAGGDISSAQLFREIFNEKNPCVKGTADIIRK